MHRAPIEKGYSESFGASLLFAAVLTDGPMQREDKKHARRHLLVVKSAIANSFDSKGISEFEAPTQALDSESESESGARP